ncbi:MAG TPA: twin-arginine translocase TatA/TatE family subunit [Candidatus Hydrogenedentes bacterium]|nr:twin-arginine translocase TatA/TatE family subunit [Candidatus Hydrogenedentota bacterium]HIJ73924.1 twin-arginine translocase TatA/TatE family subunit [Candidatus Hydrogenedentota bacterium]
MFGSWGIGELLIVLAIVLLLFGAGKLPQLGRSLGGFISEFKESTKSKSKDEQAEKSQETETE